MADIFISHSSHDNEAAAAIGERIRRERPTWSLFYDKDNIRAGQRWQERLREELQSCRVVLAVLSRNWLSSPWCFTEAVTASFRGKDVVGIAIEDLTSADLQRAPPILRERQRVRLRDGDERPWQEILEALDRSGLDPNDWFPIPPNVGPYPGLVAFDEKDAGVFFGRKQEITDYLGILDTLRSPDRSQVLVISGASGSGKSSLLRAGLIPRLRRKPEWILISPFEVAREPVRNLLDQLGKALAAVGAPAEGLDFAKPPGTSEALSHVLDEVLRRLEQQTKAWILLPLDQAEVLLAGDRPVGDPASQLLNALAEVLGKQTRHVVVVATIRTEFVPRLEAAFPRSEVRLRQIPLSTIGSLPEVIEKPAERFGLELEPGLSGTIVNDVQTADALPLLAYTLKALYEQGRADQRFTLGDYQALGGVQGAIAAKLQEVLTDPEPTAEEIQSLRRAFTRYLIRVDETAVEGERLLRRVVPRTSLPQAADRITGRLVDAGLLVTKDGTIELAHERLIDDWPQLPLKTWLAQDASSRRLIDQLRQRANDDILPDGLLAQAEDLLQRDPELQQDEETIADLVQRSKDQKLAGERRRRVLLGGAVIAAVMFAAVAGFAWIQWSNANAATEEAKKQTQLAISAKEQADNNARLADKNAADADAAAKQAQVERDRARMQLLAVQARRLDAEADTPDEIELAGALALESIEIARKGNYPIEANAVEASRSALSQLPLQLLQYSESIQALAVLPDGRLVSAGGDFVGSYGGEIRIWPKDGIGEPMILQHGSAVLSLTVLPDGRLASGGRDEEIKLWRLDDSEPEVLDHGSDVRALTVLPDGRLASAGIEGIIRLWPKDGSGVPMVLQHGSAVLSLAVLPDGRLASGGEDGRIRLWPKVGKRMPIVLSHGDQVKALAVLPDGRLASGGEGGKIRLWRIGGNSEPIVLQHSSQGIVQALAVLSDGRLASGGTDGKIKLWPRSGEGGAVVLSHGGNQVTALALLPDGRLASGGGDFVRERLGDELVGEIRLWPKDGNDEPIILPHDDAIAALAVLPDGRLATGHSVFRDNRVKIKLWPKEDGGKPLVFEHGRGGFVHALAVLPDGRLASAGGDYSDNRGEIKLWPKDGKGEPVVLTQNGPVTALAVLPDGRLASGGEGGKIRLWRIGGNSEPIVLQHSSQGIVQALAVLSDGRLASGGSEGIVKLWPKDDGGSPIEFEHGSPVLSLAVLPDERLASGGEDGKIRLWLDQGDPLILQHGRPVQLLTVLPDGRLASAGSDYSDNLGEIKLWPKDGKGEPVVLTQNGPVTALAVLPDGRLASGESNLKLWLVEQEKLIAALCLRAGRNLSRDEWARYIGLDIPWQPSCRDRPSNWRTPDP